MDLATIILQVMLISMETALPLAFMFMGVYLVFRLLNDFDLTVDGAFPLGGATAAVLLARGVHPIWATLFAVILGCLAGLVTGLMHIRLRITLLLAGIISMIGLYTVNLRLMGRPNVALLNVPTIFSFADEYTGWSHGVVVVGFMLVLAGVVAAAMIYFLKTEIGLTIRATGSNPMMVRSLGVNTAGVVVLCLIIANGLVSFSGALVAQDQGFADISMGIGSIVAGIASILLGEIIVRKPNRVARGVIAIVVGTLFYRFVITLALRFGMEPYDLRLFTALILLFAISTPMWLRRVWQLPFVKRKAKTQREEPELARVTER